MNDTAYDPRTRRTLQIADLADHQALIEGPRCENCHWYESFAMGVGNCNRANQLDARMKCGGGSLEVHPNFLCIEFERPELVVGEGQL